MFDVELHPQVAGPLVVIFWIAILPATLLNQGRDEELEERDAHMAALIIAGGRSHSQHTPRNVYCSHTPFAMM